VAEALPLLQSSVARARMTEGYERLRTALGEPGVTRRAAAAILDGLPTASPV
jgi:lipid-A-disaccharide synthase